MKHRSRVNWESSYSRRVINSRQLQRVVHCCTSWNKHYNHLRMVRRQEHLANNWGTSSKPIEAVTVPVAGSSMRRDQADDTYTTSRPCHPVRTATRVQCKQFLVTTCWKRCLWVIKHISSHSQAIFSHCHLSMSKLINGKCSKSESITYPWEMWLWYVSRCFFKKKKIIWS